MQVGWRWGALGLVVALWGCPQEPGELALASESLGPVVAGDHLVYADLTREALVVVSPDAGDVGAIERVSLTLRPERLVALPGDVGVLALATSEEALVHAALPAGPARRYDLGAAFDGLSVSPDGGAALAWFPTTSTVPAFHNGGEMAIVDLALDPEAPGAVTRRTLGSLGRSPHGVFISPPWPAMGGRRLALVLSQSHVAVLDLADPAAREHSVPLVSLGQSDVRTPHRVDFALDPSGDALWALVLTQEGSSAYALRFTDRPGDAAPGDPATAVVLQQLTGTSAGGDARLLETPDGLVALLVSPAKGTLTQTDLATGEARTLTLGAGTSRLTPFEDGGRPMMAAWRPGQRALHLVDVLAIATKKDKAATTRWVESPLDDLRPLPGSTRLLAFHPGTTHAVSVIDAATGRITPFGQTGAVRAFHLDPDLGVAFLLTRLGALDQVVSLDLASLHPTVTQLAYGADTLLVVPGAETVAVPQRLPGGRLTLWPAFDVSEEAARVLPAPLFDGLLDRLSED